MIRSGGVVLLLYCLLGGGGGDGYFQVDYLVITVRVFSSPGCGQIIRAGGRLEHCPVRGNNTAGHLPPPHTVNLASQKSSKQDQRK